MRFYLAAALMVLGGVSVPAAAANRPDIEIHAVADCANSIAPPQLDPQSHQEICVAPTMIVGGADVTGVRDLATPNGDDVLEVELSEKAASTFSRYTLSRVGQRIAILIDGKLINAPVMLQPLMGRRFQIVSLSKGEITAIVERFKVGPPI
jgi:preprotein translocase subunit SecD